MLVGLILFTEKQAHTQLTNKEKVVIDALFEQTKPQCVGRYIIDVPINWENSSHDSVFIDDFRINSQFIYPPAFRQRIELRETELREWKSSAENAPVLKEIIQLPEGKGVIFDRNQPGSDDAYRTLEAHVYVNHVAFVITTNIRDFSDNKYEKKKLAFLARGFTEIQSNEKPTKITTMQSLISRLQGRLDHEIPMEKGVCIPNGFILDEGEIPKQNISFVYDMGQFIFSIESDNRFVGSSDTLLSRSTEINAAIRQQNRETIKKGNLSPSDIPSQEWLVKGRQEVYSKSKNKRIPDLPYYFFTFNANEATGSLTIPKLYIIMNNRNKFTSYSDAQMVEIWDRIISSLRYKQNAF
ncbi:T6SS immunity protein Tli4 family protein [Providencia rustigianii]|uniref:Tle cognate immunity protein 4 C-terminal domain-containing protein n=3 Tax=Providencia rustigianii TaxID=158850 RepID=D1P860_9GAMM|nr:T6SS immunity protein Tli4 family protein [Providencia rustigianii]EFB70423.1 hypothetical protein PROVRUST_08441 [Providencia rustigianii DSM 4541]